MQIKFLKTVNKKAKNILASKYFRLSIVGFLFIILFLIPQLLWKGYGYVVGGDDSLLHYVYPDEMINNFAKNIAVNNSLSGQSGYNENLYLLPILYLISIVNHMTGISNSLYIFLGLILSLSFISFFTLLNEILPKLKKYYFIEKILISLLYTFFVHHYLSVMGHKLLAMYIVFLIPFVLMLFSKAIIENKSILLIPASIVTSIFSVVLMGVPWLFGYLISASGLLLYLFIQYPKRFILFSAKLFLLLIAMNIYWIFHFIFAVLSNTSETGFFNNILTKDFREENIQTILSVTSKNNLWQSMIGLFHPDFQKFFNWESYLVYQNWHSHFIFLNILILSFICLATFLYKRDKRIQFFPFAIFGWIVSLYFFTVNILGLYGIRVFLFMNKIIPGFSMFRNNYDKFASGFSFAFTILLFATTVQINQNKKISKIIKKIWLITLILFTIATIYPVVMGNFEKNILFSTKNTSIRVEKLDEDFIQFSNELKIVENKSILWMPFNKGSYAMVQDNNNKDNIFIGVSPLLYLSNVHDYAGTYSFNSRQSKAFLSAIDQQDSNIFGELLKEIGITHIAVNNTLSDEIKNSYLYGEEFISKQSSTFTEEFLGEKVLSINEKYVLYKVKDKYYQEQFYFSENCFVTDISLISRETYKIKFNVLEKDGNDSCKLIFKYPYHRLWMLKHESNEESSSPTDLYQNSWIIDKNLGEAIVYFKPRSYVNLLFIISGVVVLLSLVFYIKEIIKKHE